MNNVSTSRNDESDGQLAISTADLAIGINIDGAIVHDGDEPLSIADQFTLLGHHFDYVEKSLRPGEDLLPWLRASDKSGVPVRVLGGVFHPEDDIARARTIMAQAVGNACQIMNLQILPPSGSSAQALDQVGEFYMTLLEDGDKGRCLPTIEIHIDMWSERFSNINRLADWLIQRGAAIHLTLDHSHLLFRLGNAAQLRTAGLEGSSNGGWRELHPDSPAALYRRWLDNGWIAHAHARSVALNAPDNAWAERAPGVAGRGVQYPFRQPPADSWPQRWEAAALTPWKTALGQLIEWKRANPAAPLQKISCEFIPFPDYGGGTRYSLIEQNIACAAWLRENL